MEASSRRERGVIFLKRCLGLLVATVLAAPTFALGKTCDSACIQRKLLQADKYDSSAMGARSRGDSHRWLNDLWRCIETRKKASGERYSGCGFDQARLAEVYCAAKNWEKARAVGMTSLEMLRTTAGGEKDSSPASLMAKLAIARSQAEMEYLDSSEMGIQEILSSQLKLSAEDSAKTFAVLARICHQKGDSASAASAANLAYHAFLTIPSENVVPLLGDMEDLAFVMAANNDYEDAESLQRQILALREKFPPKLIGAKNPIAESRGRLGVILQLAGKMDEADSCFAGINSQKMWSNLNFFPEMLKLCRIGGVLKSENHEVAQKCEYQNLTKRICDKISGGKLNDAEILAWRIVLMVYGSLNEDPCIFLDAVDNLMVIYERRESLGAFEYDVPGNSDWLLRKAMAIEDSIHFSKRRCAKICICMGDHFLDQKKYDESKNLFEKALELLKNEKHESELSLVSAAFWGMSKEEFATGNYANAEVYGRELLNLEYRQNNDLMLMSSIGILAQILEFEGKYVQLEMLRGRQLEIASRIKMKDDDIMLFLGSYANASMKVGKYYKADTCLQKVLNFYKKRSEDDEEPYSTSLQEAARLLSEVKVLEGKYEAADSLGSLAWNSDFMSDFADSGQCILDDESSYESNRILGCLEWTGLRFREGMFGSADTLINVVQEMCRRSLDEAERRKFDSPYEDLQGSQSEEVRTLSSYMIQADLFLGVIREGEGQFDVADSLIRSAMQRMESQIGREHPNMSVFLEKLAGLEMAKGSFEEADSLYARALAIGIRSFGSVHPMVGKMLANGALAKLARKDTLAAESMLRQALVIAKGSNDPTLDMEIALALEMWSKVKGNPDLAIFWGKMAVNSAQGIRGGIRDTMAGKSYLSSTRHVYRTLVEALIERGRLAEAQQVLGFLKNDEQSRFQRDEESFSTRIAMDSLEAAWADSLGRHGRNLLGIGRKVDSVEAAEIGGDASSSGKAMVEDLKREREAANVRFSELFARLEYAFAGVSDADRARIHSRFHVASMYEEAVRRLEDGAVLLQYVLSDSTGYVLAISHQGVTARRFSLGERQARLLVGRYLKVLEDPSQDPRPLGRKLYTELIGPLTGLLDSLGAKTLMLSLDGPLRYLPMATLYDGRGYLVERYALSVYTEASHATLAAASASRWSVAGLGCSKGGAGFDSLPSVRKELRGIVRTDSTPDGILPGSIRMDAGFTKVSLQNALAERHSVVHLASHFSFSPYGERSSYLLLGDGSHLDLHELRTGPYSFRDVDLLTLSACQTAVVGNRDANGVEIEGMATIAQERGAKAVMASLWPVADASTQQLMRDFYHEHGKGVGKAAALRQAQLLFLHGPDGKASAKKSSEDGLFIAPKEAPYAHPYYWAPFVLMGNWL